VVVERGGLVLRGGVVAVAGGGNKLRQFVI